MSLLETVRSWFRSLFGGEPEPTEPDDAPAEPESTEPRLDPDGVTEVRRQSDDDPIDRLREVKEKREEQAREGDGTGGGVEAEETDSGAGS